MGLGSWRIARSLFRARTYVDTILVALTIGCSWIMIVAETVSSFNLHTDYHRASDEVKTIDFAHMTRSIQSMFEPVLWLANSTFRPKWREGMCPLPCGGH